MRREQVLDHGYVVLVEAWGSDERIIEAARMSTQKGFLGWGTGQLRCKKCGTDARDGESGSAGCRVCGTELVADVGDEKLLKFLWDNRHMTPFEMAGVVVEVQAPIFVFREWHRHRTQSYNEMSARYAPLPDVNYVPSVERMLIGGGANRQAGTVRGADALTEATAEGFRSLLDSHYVQAEELYQRALAEGVPKELARLCLPVGRYSRMRASANLRNWLQFLDLRRAPNAQWEIRQFANAVANLLGEWFPRTMALHKSVD